MITKPLPTAGDEQVRHFSQEQLAYVTARAAFNVAYEAHREYDQLMDAECEKLGIETPFGILPDGHPMWKRAQELLDKENATRTAMYAAAHALFDWAISETFKHCGTRIQKAQILDMAQQVKQMAWVEKPFEELVDLSMRLAA